MSKLPSFTQTHKSLLKFDVLPVSSSSLGTYIIGGEKTLTSPIFYL